MTQPRDDVLSLNFIHNTVSHTVSASLFETFDVMSVMIYTCTLCDANLEAITVSYALAW